MISSYVHWSQFRTSLPQVFYMLCVYNKNVPTKQLMTGSLLSKRRQTSSHQHVHAHMKCKFISGLLTIYVIAQVKNTGRTRPKLLSPLSRLDVRAT